MAHNSPTTPNAKSEYLNLFGGGLAELDYDRIEPDATMIVLGKRGTGKSTAMQEYVRRNKHKWGTIVAFSNTEKMVGDLKKWLPDIFIYDSFDIEGLEEVMKRAAIVTNPAKAWELGCKNPYTLIYLDDIMDDNSLFFNKVFRTIFMNGRHFKVGLICGTQYYVDVPKKLRSQTDYFIQLRSLSEDSLKMIHREAGSMLQFNHFCNMINDYTKDRQAVAIKTRGDTSTVVDVFRWTKSEYPTPPFKLDNADLYAFHDYHYMAPQTDMDKDWHSFVKTGSFMPSHQPLEIVKYDVNHEYVVS